MGVLKEDRSGSTIKAVGDLDPIRMNQGEREKGGGEGRREKGGGRREEGGCLVDVLLSRPLINCCCTLTTQIEDDFTHKLSLIIWVSGRSP